MRNITFLEFVLHRLVGPPRGHLYPCPFREHSSGQHHVVVNAPRINERTGREHPIKGRCHRGCGPGPGGCFSEFDVLRAVRPSARYPERLAILADLRGQYEAQLVGKGVPEAAGYGCSPPTFSFPRERTGPIESVDDPRVSDAWSMLCTYFDQRGIGSDRGYSVLREMYERGHFRDFGRWARYVLEFWRLFIESRDAVNAEHIRACEDAGCEWACCRFMQGLPPLPSLTVEQHLRRARQRKLEAEEHQRQMDETLQGIYANVDRLPEVRR